MLREEAIFDVYIFDNHIIIMVLAIGFRMKPIIVTIENETNVPNKQYRLVSMVQLFNNNSLKDNGVY